MPNSKYFSVKDRYVQWKMNSTLFEMVKGVEKDYDTVSLICIGTDRSTGDSFGPLTGHMLSKLRLIKFDLYGTLEKPVHALTLSDVMKGIDTERSLVIAVDAGVGNADMIGCIGMSYDPLKPGSGLGKDLPSVGDISLTGIVAMGGLSPFVMLQNAPLGMVYDMAEKTFFAIQYALMTFKFRKNLEKNKISFADKNFIRGCRPTSYTVRNG